jgi:hypothetical protein
MTAYMRCVFCGYPPDTPNHVMGCQMGRLEATVELLRRELDEVKARNAELMKQLENDERTTEREAGLTG